MDNLDGVLKAVKADPGRGIFVSRSGAEKQRELAIWVASRLKANGYIPILQDAHFKHADFMLAMDAALASGARVLALVSREYLASQHCMKEATAALDDQRNSSGRLVLLNIDECQPLGVLRYIDRVNFAPVWRANDAAGMERVLLNALEAPADLDKQYLLPSAMDAAQIVHPQVLMHDEDAFTGREEDLARLRDLLWNGGTAALTRAGAKGLIDEATLAGMGGIGKTTLARAYAFRNRADYHAVWWLRAESTETLIDDLIDLGKKKIPGLDRMDDREAAAREALSFIATSGTNRPWLLVYDNAQGPGVVGPWRPERNAHVIVTSRNPAWDAAVPLDVLTREAAVELLCDTAGRRSEKDREEAAALAEQLGRLPLALAHAASKCRGSRRISFADYGRRLAEFWADKPGERAAHGRYPRSVHATFTLALDEIVAGGPAGDPAPCPEAETVIGVLAQLAPEEVPDFLLKPLYDGGSAVLTEAALDRALEELAAAGLVRWGEFQDGALHLGVHRLVQEIVRARLEGSRRAAEIAALATRAVQRSFDFTESFEAQTRNHRWLPQAIEAVQRAPRAGADAWYTLWTQLQIGDLHVTRGSLGRALTAYQDGRALADDLSRADSGDAGRQRDLSVAHNRFGDVLVAQGNLPAALEAYHAAQGIIERLAWADPENADWQRDLSVSQEKIGDVSVAQGKLPAALEAYEASLGIRERLAGASPGNAGWQRDLSMSHERIGNVLVAQGKLPAALEAYRAALGIRERLAEAGPGNAGSQRDLFVSHWRIADIQRNQGDLDAALAEIRKGEAIVARLAAHDSGNTGWQHDLVTIQDFVGDVHVAQGNSPAALEAYRASLGIAERLAKADPGNAGWQRDLSVVHNKIGEVLVAQGNLPVALEAHQASLEIMERLAKTDPGNAGWQRDLSVTQEKIGDVLRSQGNLAAALDAYRASLAIRERLAGTDPGNAGWWQDVALSLQRVGLVAAQQQRRADALAAYRRGLDIMRRLTKLAPDHVGFKRDFAWLEARIAELPGAETATPAAEAHPPAEIAEAPPPPAEAPSKPAGDSWLARLLRRKP
jgi:tetratricopeptide (TPR) repeat protein